MAARVTGSDRRLVGVLREPRGRVIAEVYEEGSGVRAVERHVTQGHTYRARDAWPLGERALDRARDLGVDLLRYITPGGIWEVPLATFEAQAEPVVFAHEVQWVLSRRAWRLTPHIAERTPAPGAHDPEPAPQAAATPAREEQLDLFRQAP